MAATKFCKQKCCFLTFFCPADDQVAHKTYITLCKRHIRVVPDKQKASVKELVVDYSTNYSSSDINKISVSGTEENTVFTDPKDGQVKHYPNKRVVTLSIGSG